MQPLLQTILVDSSVYPRGIYISSLELFFQTKDSTLPVTVSLGPVIDTVPSVTQFYENSTVSVYPSEVATSTTATSATKFRFPRPILLRPGLHYFSVMSNSNKYNLYTAVVGEKQFGTTLDIVSPPYVGAMDLPSYGSRNNSPNEDVKFVINRCAFSTGTASVVLQNQFPLSSATDTDPIDQDGLTQLFDVFYVTSDREETDTSTTAYSYRRTTEGGVVDTTYTPFQTGTNINVSRSKLNSGTFKVKIDVTNNDSFTTPIFDINRVHGVFIRNRINNDTTNENQKVGGNAEARYVTKVVELLPEIDANDIVAFALLKLPPNTDVKVYYKAAAAGQNIVTDVSYQEMVKTPIGTPNSDVFVEYKFSTSAGNAIADGSYYNKFIFKIVLLSSGSDVPVVKDFRGIALND